MTEPLITVPLSYVAALMDGDVALPRSQRDRSLAWWSVDETSVPRYVGRNLTPGEVIAHGEMSLRLDLTDDDQ